MHFASFGRTRRCPTADLSWEFPLPERQRKLLLTIFLPSLLMPQENREREMIMAWENKVEKMKEIVSSGGGK